MEPSRVVIVYEAEATCRDRLVAAGWRPEAAEEVACYLAQATDLDDFKQAIAEALGAAGMAVEFVELDGFLDAARRLPRGDPATLVWCLTDGIRYYRGSSVAAVARLAGWSYFGSPPQAQHLCQDKYKCSTLAAALGLDVPASALLEDERAIAGAELLDRGGPFFVKPNTLGAKIGIFADSRCEDARHALAASRRLWRLYRDRALVQRYLPGDDVRVSFMDVGSDGAGTLGIAQLLKHPDSETGGEFMTARDNASLSGSRDTGGTVGAFGQRQRIAFVPRLSDLRRAAGEGDGGAAGIVDAVGRAVPRIVELFGLADYFSVDFRVAAGAPHFLEFEVCPAVTIYDFQTYLRDAYGLALPAALVAAFRRSLARQGAAPAL